MPEEALLDAAVDVEVEKPSEETHEASESDAGSDLGEASSASETPELKGSSLWRDVKGPLFSGKSLTKDQIRAVQKAIQAEAQISAKYPTGLGEVETVLEAAKALAEDESIPLPQAIQETLQEKQYYRELDSFYTKDPAKFAEKLIDASPEAFENLAPQVIRKYAELNPEGYSAQVAQAVVQHMNGAEVPLQFRILTHF